MVHQYLYGLTPLNLRAAAAFAAGLGCSIKDFSPSLAADVIAAARFADGELLIAAEPDTQQLLRLYSQLGKRARDELLGNAYRLAGEGKSRAAD